MKKFTQLYDRDWLCRRYIDDKKSQSEIAFELGCSRPSVSIALRRFGIPPRPKERKYNRLDDREWLHSQYVVAGLTMDEIAQIIGCSVSAVFQSLREHSIIGDQNEHDHRRANTGSDKNLYNRDWLAQQYKQRGAKSIAQEIGCHLSSVYRALKRYGLIGKARLPHADQSEFRRRQLEGIEKYSNWKINF